MSQDSPFDYSEDDGVLFMLQALMKLNLNKNDRKSVQLLAFALINFEMMRRLEIPFNAHFKAIECGVKSAKLVLNGQIEEGFETLSKEFPFDFE